MLSFFCIIETLQTLLHFQYSSFMPNILINIIIDNLINDVRATLKKSAVLPELVVVQIQ